MANTDADETLALLLQEQYNLEPYPGQGSENAEHLRQLQEALLASVYPRKVNFFATPCFGNWERLCVEMKQEVLKYLLKSPAPITSANAHEIINHHDLIRYCFVSQGVRDIAEQVFYQFNTIKLQPMSTREDGTKISLKYPPQHVNRYISVLEYHRAEFNNLPQGFNFSTKWFREREQDTWQFLKNIALGKYGFQKLDKIMVFFEAKPYYMQCFWNWTIRIKVGANYVDIDPDTKDWESELATALKDRHSHRFHKDEPGFELIRKMGPEQNEGWCPGTRPRY